MKTEAPLVKDMDDALALHEFLEKELRNPQVDFTNEPNLAVQTGYQSISQIIDEFDRAGRAILVANADQNFPETPGMKLYPDPIEAILLEREVNAELMIARRRLEQDQEEAKKNAEERGKKNEAELQRMKKIIQEAELEKTTQPTTEG